MLITISFSIKPNPNIKIFNQFFVIFTSMSSSSSSSKIIAEYAKSNRSSCKKCEKKIEAKTLRMGFVIKDPRGFDMPKWHHLQCLPLTTVTAISSPEAVVGFSSLKSSDQEAINELVSKSSQQTEEAQNEDDATNSELDKTQEKKRTAQDEDDATNTELDQSHKKKRVLVPSKEELELEISLSEADIKNVYKDATLLPKWKAYQTVIFLERDEGLHDSTKIAAFDFDGCLANTSMFKPGADMWSLMYPSIPDKLKTLYDDGYKLVIFTNEANIELWKKKRQAAVDSKLGRLENFIKRVNLPIQVFIACGHKKTQPNDPYRKPKPGMWRILEKHFNSGLTIDMDQSFYVGDAAGRVTDHSDADIKFAEAVGLKFHLPEDFFAS